MRLITDIARLTAALVKGIFLYIFYGPPCKSWNLKTWIIAYVSRSVFVSVGNVLEYRAMMKYIVTPVRNSKTEKLAIQDKFRERAHELVKKHLREVYGDDEWYGPESHWSKSYPLKSEWIIPNHLNRSSNSNVILYIHGGAYIMGNFSMYRSELETLAHGTDSIVLGANYRLSPEYSAPCQLEDALAHILYLTSPVEDSGIGLSFDQIVVSGDSAGGGLASILNHFMRDANIGKLAGALLYSPWLDLASPHPSYSDCADTDTLPVIVDSTYGRDSDGRLIPEIFKTSFEGFDSEIQNRMIERDHFFAPKKYLNSPLVSALCDNNFSDLPATFIISAPREKLRDESYLYHEAINNSYSEEELSEFKIPPTTLHFYEEMVHIFHMVLPELESSRKSVKRAINFIKQCFAQKLDDFNSVKADNPINLGADNNTTNSTTPKQWRNLYLSTASDHSLISFAPDYRRAVIKTWGKTN